MSVGQVEQVSQSASSPVSPLITDAVFQNHVVGPDGPQDVVHLLWGPSSVHLIHLLAHVRTQTEQKWIYLELCGFCDCFSLPKDRLALQFTSNIAGESKCSLLELY